MATTLLFSVFVLFQSVRGQSTNFWDFGTTVRDISIASSLLKQLPLDVATKVLGDAVSYQSTADNDNLRTESSYDMFDWASAFGYPLQNFFVTTPDNYILQIFRIPHGRNVTENSGKVLFLQHGLGCNSETWLFNGADSLAFTLADLGYDVWLGNYRGSFYSRNHTFKNPDIDPTFWDFCYDEHGKYDLPTMIDFVLQNTNKSKLGYIGHSMGTTGAFVMLSSKPQYNDKLTGFVAMAPVVTVRYAIPSLEQTLSLGLEVVRQAVGELTEIIPMGESSRRTEWTNLLYSTLCPASEPVLCQTITTLVNGVMPAEIYDQQRYALLAVQCLSGSSIRQLLHYMQTLASRTFTKFDFGTIRNLVTYKQTEPPKYDLSKVTTPTVALWGDNDQLATPLDAAILLSQLPNLVSHNRVDHVSYTHASFIDSPHNTELLYPLVLDAIETWFD